MLNEKKVSTYTPSILGLWARGSSESAIFILEWVWRNKVTDDFGADINSEFPVRTGPYPSNRYCLFALIPEVI